MSWRSMSPIDIYVLQTIQLLVLKIYGAKYYLPVLECLITI